MTSASTSSPTSTRTRSRSAALQRSKFGVTAEVVALYAICLFVAHSRSRRSASPATGGSWTNVYTAMLDGSIRKPGRWGLTLGVSAPILLVALGTIVNGRAGLVNIGQEGQLVIGSCFAAYVGVRLGGPRAVRAGRRHAVRDRRRRDLGRHRRRAALLPQRARGADHVADGHRRRQPDGLGPAQPVAAAGAGGRAGQPQPGQRTARRRHPHPAGHVVRQRVPDSACCWHWRSPSSSGSSSTARWSASGCGCSAATPGPLDRAGVAERRYGIGAMLVSGGFAGLAGGVMLAGGDFGNYQLVANFGAGIGFAGLLAALVARQRVLVRDLRRVPVRLHAHRLRLPSRHRRVRPHRRRRAGPARAGAVAASGDPLRPRAPPGAVRRRVRGSEPWATSSPRSATSPPTRAPTATPSSPRSCCCSPRRANWSPRRRARSTSRSRR